MRVQAIIVDLDRTLLHTNKTVSDYTIAVLRKCKENAIKLMAATARPLRDTLPFCALIGFDAITVSNGARVLCKAQQKEFGICTERAEQLLTYLLQQPNFRITLETGDRAYSNKPIEDYETVLTDDLLGVAKAEGALKILVHLDTEETLPIVKNALTEDLYATTAHGYLMQIMSKAATKWNGIHEMLRICNCTADQAVYFGDDQDDIEPIKMCGVGVAVENGLDEAKAVADYITESNDADGVAKFIVRMIWNDKI